MADPVNYTQNEIEALKNRYLNSADYLQGTLQTPQPKKDGSAVNNVPEIKNHFETEVLDIIRVNLNKKPEEEIIKELINSWKNHVALARAILLYRKHLIHLYATSGIKPPANQSTNESPKDDLFENFEIGDEVTFEHKIYATQKIISMALSVKDTERWKTSIETPASTICLGELNNTLKYPKGQNWIYALGANEDTLGWKAVKLLINIITFGAPAFYNKKFFWEMPTLPIWKTPGDKLLTKHEKILGESYCRMNPLPRGYQPLPNKRPWWKPKF